jgi:hypothetical protein
MCTSMVRVLELGMTDSSELYGKGGKGNTDCICGYSVDRVSYIQVLRYDK